jgi:hypothetical protein
MDENGITIGLTPSSAPPSSSQAAAGTGNSKGSTGNTGRKALGNLSPNVTNLSASARRADGVHTALTPDKMDGKSLMRMLSSPVAEEKATNRGTHLEIVEKHRSSKVSKGLRDRNNVEKTAPKRYASLTIYSILFLTLNPFFFSSQ